MFAGLFFPWWERGLFVSHWADLFRLLELPERTSADKNARSFKCEALAWVCWASSWSHSIRVSDLWVSVALAGVIVEAGRNVRERAMEIRIRRATRRAPLNRGAGPLARAAFISCLSVLKRFFFFVFFWDKVRRHEFTRASPTSSHASFVFAVSLSSIQPSENKNK